MSEALDFLLSDQFVEFSQKIKEIHEKKKIKQADFKILYDKFKAEIKVLDDEASKAQLAFEAWKVPQLKAVPEQISSEKQRLVNV